MGKNGGKREGAGRKSKAEELGLNELMDSIGPSEAVLKAVYELATGPKKNTEAQKIWLSYKFGKPKETVNLKSDNTITWIEQEQEPDGNNNS
jgi:hypothetical protein